MWTHDPAEGQPCLSEPDVYDPDAPKARIDLTPNEDLVRAVREHTDNLSDYVETLLA